MTAGAQLETQFTSSRVETAMHVLWVPEFDVPKGGYGTGGPNGGTEKLRTFGYDYFGDRTINAEHVTLRDGEFVQGGGRTYLLSRGNVFLARVSERGAVRLTQVPATLRDGDPAHVLAAIQNAIHDARVDAVRLRV